MDTTTVFSLSLGSGAAVRADAAVFRREHGDALGMVPPNPDNPSGLQSQGDVLALVAGQAANHMRRLRSSYPRILWAGREMGNERLPANADESDWRGESTSRRSWSNRRNDRIAVVRELNGTSTSPHEVAADCVGTTAVAEGDVWDVVRGMRVVWWRGTLRRNVHTDPAPQGSPVHGQRR